MAMTAISGLEPEWYTPNQPDDGAPTEFLLKPLNGMEYAAVLVHSNAAGGVSIQGVREAIRYGLIDWKNFNDADGKAVPFSQLNSSRINAVTLLELADKILEISELTGDQKKT